VRPQEAVIAASECDMSEVFGKKPVTSSEFPVLLFAANGTLLHFNPPLENYFHNQLFISGHPKTPEEIEAAWVKSLHLTVPTEFVTALLQELQIPEDKVAELSQKIMQNREGLRVVIADSTIQVCELLRDRGYHLGIVSNQDYRIAELLRHQAVLELFDVVVTADNRPNYLKPQSEGILEALDELDVLPSQCIFIGDSFSRDIVAAQGAGLKAILYDPTYRELKALAESTSEAFSKVVSIETLRQNRRLQGVKVVTQFQELLKFFL